MDLESKIAFDPRAPEKAKSKLHQKTLGIKDKALVKWIFAVVSVLSDKKTLPLPRGRRDFSLNRNN